MADTFQGTSIEDLEMGKVENTADEAKMKEILADMNMEPEQASMDYVPQHMETMPQMPHMPSMDPMAHMRQRRVPMYQEEYQEDAQEYEEEVVEKPKYKVAKKPKRNNWSISVESLIDPILVGILICLLSLPVLHTWGGKHVLWAYKMGGELSWPGLFTLGVIGAGLFALFRFVKEYLNGH
jgi:hypothetical protein